MSEPRRRPLRLQPWMVAVWLGFAIAAVVLAYWGWLSKAPSLQMSGWRAHENAAFMALRVFGFDEAYSSPERIGSDWRLIAARWIGLAVVVSTLLTAGLALFQTQIAAILAERAEGHSLIIGDHEMAPALVAEALRRKLRVIHVSATAQRTEMVGRLITLPRTAGEDPLLLGRAAQARRVIVAETDLGASIEQALQALKQLPGDPAAPAKVAVHLDDPIVAERIHHAPGGANLFAFSEAQAAARAVMLRHPPFLLARRLKAPAVHVLIVGFGRLGQAVARDVVLNSLVSDLGAPHITVIDPDKDAVRKDFIHKHPEFDAAGHFLILGDLDELDAEADKPPICALYVCLRDSAEALSTAITYSERASRHELIQGPIFARLRSGGPLRPDCGVAALKPTRVYSFGALADAAASSLALDDDPDADAKAIHRAYAKIGGYSAEPWAALSEEMRVSNRRVVSHTPAKLASLGFDLEPWLALPDDARPWPPTLAAGEMLYRNEAERRAAAVLEHDRWMADRRVNGWRYGPARDNELKLQPYLVPFDQLAPEVQAYDFGVADWLKGYVQRAEPGLLRRAAGV